MKFEHNKSENSIKIDDGAKFQYFLIKAAMLFTFFNSLLFLYNLSENHFAMMGFIWIILGITSAILCFYFFFKISSAEEIALDRVAYLKEKNILGRRRLSLELKNGKTRNIITKNNSDIIEVKTFFARFGFEPNRSERVKQ